MAGIKAKTFKPIAANVKIYKELYKLYKQLHDSLGIAGHQDDISNVMKDLLEIKEAANA
jgi:L-ribulokinase